MILQSNPYISIILPCLNEAPALQGCLERAQQVVASQNFSAEIIVVDNGSTDSSPQIAQAQGVILVHEPQQGYGAACLRGFSSARGKYLVLLDADGSYDFAAIPKFIATLEKGYDFVIGDRFKGRMTPKAMPWMHKYIGNPLLSTLLRVFFRTNIHDVHCGMRGIRKETFQLLGLRTTGMEFASEMVIRAIKKNLKMAEVPVDYHQRVGVSKLNSLADGWRHLRFMLLYSPLFLFFLPGLFLFVVGAGVLSLTYFGVLVIAGFRFKFHPMFPAALLIMVGYQLMIFALFAKTYAITHLDDKPVFDKLYKYLTIEKASLAGVLLISVGVFIYLKIFMYWWSTHGGELNEVRNSVVALILIVLGIQTFFSAFMLSILGIKEK